MPSSNSAAMAWVSEDGTSLLRMLCRNEIGPGWLVQVRKERAQPGKMPPISRALHHSLFLSHTSDDTQPVPPATRVEPQRPAGLAQPPSAARHNSSLGMHLRRVYGTSTAANNRRFPADRSPRRADRARDGGGGA